MDVLTRPTAARDEPGPSPGRLILGQIPADFDPRRDLPIAAWCFLGAEDVYAEWEDLAFYDALTDANELARAGDAIRLLANHLLGAWQRDLDRRHGSRHTREYWRILVLPWLLQVCHAVWMRWQVVREFVDRHRETRLAVDVWLDDVDWHAEDLFDINRRIFPRHPFNFWLTSRIVGRLAPPGWSLERVSPDQPAPGPKEAAAKGPRARARRLFRNLRCRQVTGIRWAALPLSVFLAVLPARPRRVPPRPEPSAADIEGLFPASFLELIDDILPRLLPRVLGDGYAAMEAAAAGRRYRAGRTNVVGPVLILNEDDKFTLAHAAEAGERIVCTQHGGGACLKVNANGVEIEYPQDAYLSWGWSGREDYGGRIVAVPSPLYSRYADRYRRRDDHLVFVAGEERMFAHRIEICHQPAQAVASRRHRLAFLEGLPAELRARLHYRSYPAGHGVLADEIYMRRRLSDLEVITGTLEPHMLRCRLLVVDHPTTTFGLAMAANVPTIALLDPEVWAFARQAEPHFDRFREVGVVCAAPAQAARKAAAVWDDVEGWWQGPEVQAARRAFCAAYAPTSRAWWFEWAKVLWRL